jgi:hypothetical protein
VLDAIAAEDLDTTVVPSDRNRHLQYPIRCGEELPLAEVEPEGERGVFESRPRAVERTRIRRGATR